MKSLAYTVAAFVVATACTWTHSAIAEDVAVRAKAIAPFVETETAVVVHVDLSRMASQPMYALLSQVFTVAPVDMYSDKIAAIAETGAKDIYMIGPPLALLAERPSICLVIPFSSAQQEKSASQRS